MNFCCICKYEITHFDKPKVAIDSKIGNYLLWYVWRIQQDYIYRTDTKSFDVLMPGTGDDGWQCAPIHKREGSLCRFLMDNDSLDIYF